MLRNTSFFFIALYVCVVISYQMCFNFFPYNEFYLRKEGLRFLCSVLPFFFVGFIFINTEKNLSMLDKIAILSISVSFFYNVIMGKSKMEYSFQENMSAAYNLLPQCLIVLAHFFYKKNFVDVIAFAVGLFLLLGFGTRGALVSSAFTCVLLLCYSLIKGNKKLAISVLMIGCLIVFEIYSFINEIMRFFANVGLSTRIFDRLILAEKVDSSGRDLIYEKVWNNIDFLQMHGFAGDRFLLGTYSHNLFLEMWYSFGLLGGTLILLLIFAVIIIALYYSEKRDAYFLIVLIGFVFGQLLFSGSFLHQGWLYFLIGYSINIIIKSRKKNYTAYL